MSGVSDAASVAHVSASSAGEVAIVLALVLGPAAIGLLVVTGLVVGLDAALHSRGHRVVSPEVGQRLVEDARARYAAPAAA